MLKARLARSDVTLTPALRGLVARLVEMERRNLQTLGERMNVLQRQLADLDESRSKLKRIHQSYAGHLRLTASFSSTA